MKFFGTSLRVKLALVSLSTLTGLAGCVSSSDNSGGSSGNGGASNAGGSTSNGGASGMSSGVCMNGPYPTPVTGDTGAIACMPPSPTEPLITDFTYTAGATTSTTDASFGDFTTVFSGGTYVYSGVNNTLVSDVTMNNWHITGSVGDYSGFGLFFSTVNMGATVGCSKVDASVYQGISFTVSGNVPSLTVTVGTAADDVSATWLNTHTTPTPDPLKPPTFASCMPASSQYDGTCASPSKSVPVTAAPQTVSLRWCDFSGGKPKSTVNPQEITFITWVLPNPPAVGTANVMPYDADVTIDDLKFIQ